MRTEFPTQTWMRPERHNTEILASRVIAAALAALAVAVGIWLRDWKVGLGLGSIPAVLLAATCCVRSEGGAPSRRPSPSDGGLPFRRVSSPAVSPVKEPAPRGTSAWPGPVAMALAPQEDSASQRSAPHSAQAAAVDPEAPIDLSPIPPLTVGETQVTVVRGSITDQRVDVIVNAANSRLAGGSGVDAAILKAAGRAPYDECHERYPQGCPTGQAVWTGPGRLAEIGVKGIVHAVGPIWNADAPSASQDLAYRANRAAVKTAALHGATTVAMPFLSAGAFLKSIPEAARDGVKAVLARTALQAVVDSLREASPPTRLREVRFVVWEADAVPPFRAAFEAQRQAMQQQE